MDEAERCDRIVYILNGRLVTRGTVPQVIAASGLVTFVIEGEKVRHLIEVLRGRPGWNMSPFSAPACMCRGATGALMAALETLRADPALAIHEAPPSLEDVFIQLQEQAR
jgi:ABC-2 type transport system ATP-binding protein